MKHSGNEGLRGRTCVASPAGAVTCAACALTHAPIRWEGGQHELTNLAVPSLNTAVQCTLCKVSILTLARRRQAKVPNCKVTLLR